MAHIATPTGIPKLLRLGLHWGKAMFDADAQLRYEFLSFYA